MPLGRRRLWRRCSSRKGVPNFESRRTAGKCESRLVKHQSRTYGAAKLSLWEDRSTGVRGQACGATERVRVGVRRLTQSKIWHLGVDRVFQTEQMNEEFMQRSVFASPQTNV